MLAGMNRILHERNLEEYYCTLCYAMFEFKKKTVTFANSGLPFPVKCSNGKAEQIDMPGVPLGSFGGSTLRGLPGAARGRATCSCSARTESSRRSTKPARNSAPTRVIDVVEQNYTMPAKDIVNAMFSAVQNFCGDAEQSDDRTVVVVKVNQLGRQRPEP